MKLVAAIVCAAAGVAAAQPEPPATTPAPGEAPPPPVDEAPPPAPPPPAPAPAPAPAPVPVPAAPEAVAPTDLALGIGIGYQFTTFMNSLETPNIASAALRLANGLTIEPSLIVRNTSQTMEDQPTPSMSTSSTELGLGALVKWPAIRRHHTELDVLGAFLVDSVRDNPDGPDNDTKTTTMTGSWGIGIGYWITRHWQVSFDATNPVFSYIDTSKQTSSTTAMKSSSTTFVIEIDPTIAIMVHLYN